MKKLMTAGLLVILLSGCSAASSEPNNSELSGEWICHSIPTKDSATYDRLDHFILNADGSGSLRGISSIDLEKDLVIRYLTKGKVNWQNKNNVLSFDFINRKITPAHSKNVAKVVKNNPDLQRMEKEKFDDFYCKCSDHVEMPIELKNNGKKLILGEDYAICRRATENDKDIQLLNKFFSGKK